MEDERTTLSDDEIGTVGGESEGETGDADADDMDNDADDQDADADDA